MYYGSHLCLKPMRQLNYSAYINMSWNCLFSNQDVFAHDIAWSPRSRFYLKIQALMLEFNVSNYKVQYEQGIKISCCCVNQEAFFQDNFPRIHWDALLETDALPHWQKWFLFYNLWAWVRYEQLIFACEMVFGVLSELQVHRVYCKMIRVRKPIRNRPHHVQACACTGKRSVKLFSNLH